ncbi:MAG: phage major tail tube protein [Wolbachia sp.]
MHLWQYNTNSYYQQVEQLAFKELDFGDWKPAEKATLKRVVDAHYYKFTIDGNELIEIDAENMIRKINGIEQMALLQTVLGA